MPHIKAIEILNNDGIFSAESKMNKSGKPPSVLGQASTNTQHRFEERVPLPISTRNVPVDYLQTDADSRDTRMLPAPMLTTREAEGLIESSRDGN